MRGKDWRGVNFVPVRRTGILLSVRKCGRGKKGPRGPRRSRGKLAGCKGRRGRRLVMGQIMMMMMRMMFLFGWKINHLTKIRKKAIKNKCNKWKT